ncbi:MAG TPA: CYTH and CHAD domain-containing protein [Jatrophihabitans sp.]
MREDMVATGEASEQRERELKFDVPDSWALPDPHVLAGDGGSVTAGVVELESTYFDTADRDLLANRLTLRRRTGATDEGWQLKVPDGDARTEIRLPVNGVAAPKELQRLTHGIRRGAPLRSIAVLRTRRNAYVIEDAAGTALAELVVDEVSATLVGRAAASTWREVEVELKAGDEALLRRVAKWLGKTGATRSAASSKLARALVDVPERPTYSAKTVQGAVLSYLADQYEVIFAGDLALRRGQDVVHKTRVATRRYRSVLREFGGLFDPERAAALDAELKWYAAALGGARDLQVLRKHLFDDLDQLPPELVLGPVAAQLNEALTADDVRASRKVTTALQSKRYLALLDELHAWLVTPPLRGGKKPRGQLARYIDKAERKYAKRLATAELLEDGDPAKNELMHRARKAAKRARYTAELSVPALGRSARKSAKRAKAVQSRLGDRQDAVVSVGFLRRAGATAGTRPGENGFTYGVLLGLELQRGDVHRL